MFHACSTVYSLFMGRSILSWRNYTSAFIASSASVNCACTSSTFRRITAFPASRFAPSFGVSKRSQSSATVSTNSSKDGWSRLLESSEVLFAVRREGGKDGRSQCIQDESNGSRVDVLTNGSDLLHRLEIIPCRTRIRRPRGKILPGLLRYLPNVCSSRVYIAVINGNCLRTASRLR